MTGPKDSIIATFRNTITADGKGTSALNNRPAMPSRLIAAGGDSTVSELGPYESVTRKGMQVTTRSTVHFRGKTMTGTFEAMGRDVFTGYSLSL